eukprot:47973-Pelagomonas_calceolata.AAC.4
MMACQPCSRHVDRYQASHTHIMLQAPGQSRASVCELLLPRVVFFTEKSRKSRALGLSILGALGSPTKHLYSSGLYTVPAVKGVTLGPANVAEALGQLARSPFSHECKVPAVKGVTLGPADVAEALGQLVRSDGRAAVGGIIRPARCVPHEGASSSLNASICVIMHMWGLVGGPGERGDARVEGKGCVKVCAEGGRSSMKQKKLKCVQHSCLLMDGNRCMHVHVLTGAGCVLCWPVAHAATPS